MGTDAALKALTAIREGLPYVLSGVWVTLMVVGGALVMGLAIGVPMAVGNVYGSRWTRRLIAFYVWFFRGVPLLVLLFLFYFGFLTSLNLNISPFIIAIIVLGLISSAYQSQIVRGAIQSISTGQMKAAQAIGMSDREAIVRIILPQALRMAIPGWSNEYTILLKNSAVTYALGVAEIMTRAHNVAARTYQYLAMFIFAGFIFLILTYIGTFLIRRLESHVRIPGYTGVG
jgi:polar amino acid transport system permease protein